MWRLISIAFATVLAGEFGSGLNAQSYPLSEVEIRMERTPHSCPGPCLDDEVIVRGDGSVQYTGIGELPVVPGTRKRTIPVDDVVSLVNDFLQARFFDALDAHRGTTFIVRRGNNLEFQNSGGSGPSVDLTLRIGDRRKTVRLERDYPPELGRPPELVDRIGGPEVSQRQ